MNFTIYQLYWNFTNIDAFISVIDIGKIPVLNLYYFFYNNAIVLQQHFNQIST